MTKTCPHCNAKFDGDKRSTHCHDCRDTSAPWRVDEDALERARILLGMVVPARVRRMKGKALRGRYRGIKLAPEAPRDPNVIAATDDDALNALMYHNITVAVRLTPEAASRTIWHEMTHAAQYERDPDAYVEGYKRENAMAKAIAARTGTHLSRVYQHISFETEAKANESLHYTRFPLAVANKRCELPHQAGHPFVVAAHRGHLVLGPRHAEYERRIRDDITAAQRRMRNRA